MNNEKITPFHSGCEFADWEDSNCGKCKKFENESSSIEEAGCPYSFSLLLAYLDDGTVDKAMHDEYMGDDGNCKKLEKKDENRK